MSEADIKTLQDRVASLEADKAKLEADKKEWEANKKTSEDPKKKPEKDDLVSQALKAEKTEEEQLAMKTRLKRSIEDTSNLKKFLVENLSSQDVKVVEEQMRTFNDDADLEQEYLIMKILHLKDNSLNSVEKIQAHRKNFGGKYTSDTTESSGIRTHIDSIIADINKIKASRPNVGSVYGNMSGVPATLDEANLAMKQRMREKYGFLGTPKKVQDSAKGGK